MCVHHKGWRMHQNTHFNGPVHTVQPMLISYSVSVCTVVPVSANSLGISRGFTMFFFKILVGTCSASILSSQAHVSLNASLQLTTVNCCLNWDKIVSSHFQCEQKRYTASEICYFFLAVEVMSHLFPRIFMLYRSTKVEEMRRTRDTVMEKPVCQMETHMKACMIAALAVEWEHIGKQLHI